MDADILLLGRTATLGGEAGFDWVDAIAIGGGRVIAVGTAAELAPVRGRRTAVWRLPSETCATPGITDAHLHLSAAALAAAQLDLSGAAGKDAVLLRVQEAARDVPSGAWLLGHGWSVEHYAGWPTADDLESAAPGIPAAFWAHDHHARWVSRTGLARAGIDAQTPDPAGGLIRRHRDGTPSGILHEHAGTLVDPTIGRPSAEDLQRLIGTYARSLLALGITGVHDPGELIDDAEDVAGPWLYRAMAERGALPIRVVSSIRERQLERAIAWGMRTGQGSNRYRAGWLKLFADGSLGSRSAALLAPYERTDRAGAPVASDRGMLLETPEELAAHATRAISAGIAVQVHAIGDAAVRSVLDVLAPLPRFPGGAVHRVEHAQLIDPKDVPRFGGLGVAASVQPCHLGSDASQMEQAWGSRAANAFPVAALVASGGLVAFGTDAPVEPPDPWRNLAAAVARRDPSWPAGQPAFVPDQAVTLSAALRAACRAPALTLGVLDEGRLLPGYRADIAIVPAGVFDAPDPTAQSLAAIRPIATLLDGELAWAGPDWDV